MSNPTVEEMVEGRRLLIIRWEDHWASPGWVDIDERLSDSNMTPYYNVSVGWEIGRNDKVVKLARSLCEGGRCEAVIAILVADIISEEEVCFVK